MKSLAANRQTKTYKQKMHNGQLFRHSFCITKYALQFLARPAWEELQSMTYFHCISFYWAEFWFCKWSIVELVTFLFVSVSCISAWKKGSSALSSATWNTINFVTKQLVQIFSCLSKMELLFGYLQNALNHAAVKPSRTCILLLVTVIHYTHRRSHRFPC